MSEVSVYRLHITPQTKINISDNEIWMLSEKITDAYLLKCGRKKRTKQLLEGKDPKKAVKETCFITRRNYLLTYFNYKRKVNQLFLESGLKEFPVSNVWFKFYLPMPISWSKKKKRLHSFEPHISTPDTSNMHKAIEDACSLKDRTNWDYRATKFWCDLSEGFIEIHIGALEPAIGYTKFQREDKIK